MLPGAESIDKLHINHLGPLFAGRLYNAFWGAHDIFIVRSFSVLGFRAGSARSILCSCCAARRHGNCSALLAYAW
jgi:hypothetical protein